ncbi:MAG: bifunctional hydroxymethylpyrimidine kinase/phosphomethylpyrimidine kinase [Candidatus Aminicenantes bacterium]|nr:MAG: bifunctional hydroxymethylpyrimidine kinase/phosphomethylpyrimidine kinase [Candidatus Aminicenantes bacterium]
MKKILLSVAGYDPTSGAGVSLDLRIFSYLHFQGMAVLTAITSQNTKQVKKLQCVPAELIRHQYKTLSEDVAISGIKVGMVGCGENIEVIKKILSRSPNIPRVIDPVFRSSSGKWLLEKQSILRYMEAISGKASILTPNIEEAGLIARKKIKNIEDMKEAAKIISILTKTPCLIKGGHLPGRTVDILYDGDKFHFFKKNKFNKSVHGTGCFLSSSLLCYLAKGKSLENACLLATELTYNAIRKAIRVGKGQHIFSFPF